MRLSANAYAKINLILDNMGQREDGYHSLRMLMQSVSLHNRVTLEVCCGEGITVQCDGLDLPPEKSITYRAAEGFLRTFAPSQRQKQIRIQIETHIPDQAGLGGASADVATVLHLLDHAYQTRLSHRELREFGVQIGADVPFCLMGGTMLAEGIGEELTRLPDLCPCTILLAKPKEGISTKIAYQLLDEWAQKRGLVHSEIERAMTAIREENLPALSSLLFNSFEQAYCEGHLWESHGILTDLREKLLAGGALGARMSGSGTTVYGIFDSEKTARECQKTLTLPGLQTFCCHPMPIGHEILGEG